MSDNGRLHRPVEPVGACRSICPNSTVRLQTPACRWIYLAVLKHLLQTLQHLLELARLDSAVGQQHPPELPLGDSAIRRVVPFELEGGGGEQRERLRGTNKFRAWKAELVPLNLHSFH